MAPQASRRFHEAGVGSRTGLRLSAVARDQDGFEDLEAFYKASQAALDHRQDGDAGSDEAGEDDYDSFDETHFSRRSSKGAAKDARKTAPSSSSAMDLQTSSAPSPRSVLRTSRPASSYAGSPSRRSHAQAPNMTLADDDDDDFDLPNLSTGSRSFDLGALAGDEDVDVRDAPSAPARGLSARQAQPIPASAKGKKAATVRRVDLLDSDSDDQGAPAAAQRRFQNVDDDAGMSSEYDIVPTSSSPARKKHTAASANKTRSPAAKAASKVASGSRNGVAQRETTPPPARPDAAHSPKRRPAQSPKKASRPPQSPEISYEDLQPDFLHDESPQPDPQPSPPAKRKRGRPAKNQAAQSGILDDLEPEERAPPAKKKSVGRPAGSGAKSKKAAAKQRTGEVVEKVRAQPREATVIDENGVRRSTRQRFAPLEYWRGERVRYGRPSLPNDELRASQRPGEDDFEDSLAAMPVRKRVPVLDVKEVIRVPRAPGEGTFAGTTRARATRRRAAPSTAPRKAEEKLPKRGSAPPDGDEDEWLQLDPTADTVHVEDGWDRETLETGLVIDEDGEEVELSVVRTKDSLHPVMAAGQQFGFEKIFNCGGLMATGVLHLPPGTRKPTKPSKDNSFVFCVLQGALRATVHRKSFIVGPHGIFQVPAGNTYALENICQRDVHLFFAQCRKTRKANAGDLTTFTQASDTSYSVPGWTESQRVLQSPQQSKQSRHQPPPLSDDEDDFETSRQLKSKKRVFRKV